MSAVTGKSVLITGAGGGLGRAAALQFAAQGARLALTDLDPATLSETVNSTRALGASVCAFAGDIAAPATARRLMELIEEHHAVLDGVCNVAGVLSNGTIEQASVAEFDRTMHVNCLAQLLVIQHALPLLRKSRHASIVNVASIGALTALPLMAVYCASKAAVLGLTRAVAAELAPDIRCNAICPGGIDTPMSQNLFAGFSPAEREAFLPKLTGRQLLKRFASADEVAAVLVFLISDESAFMTGAVVPVDGGVTAW
jgi:NAD(P)-dependent dehydrogenase (short-subunit alcohol dehydrogenase family)